ncbi:hypothetical protein E2C01_014562 [Portunus trituberculatus]|uniref:Uncharacterized protein n=1 Tax=Portunus trituberculatus TaxID=210409 RepID=A0A5B7DKC7_PORTR|nr:hypothetical protein [Portunus trituberculatus]
MRIWVHAGGEGVEQPPASHEERCAVDVLSYCQASETLRPQPYPVHGCSVGFFLRLQPVRSEHGYGDEEEGQGVKANGPPSCCRASFPWRHHHVHGFTPSPLNSLLDHTHTLQHTPTNFIFRLW